MERKVAWVREAAGARFKELERNILIQYVQPEAKVAESHAEELDITREEMLDVAFELFGDERQISDTLVQRRERFGISYIVVFEKDLEDFAPVVAALHVSSGWSPPGSAVGDRYPDMSLVNR